MLIDLNSYEEIVSFIQEKHKNFENGELVSNSSSVIVILPQLILLQNNLIINNHLTEDQKLQISYRINNLVKIIVDMYKSLTK